MKPILTILIFIFTAAMGLSQKQDTRPNILIILADDLGYADLGCYGGDIATPNIDALASEGIRFSRYHAAPLCAVTRAMLLSGTDNHIAGMGRQGIRTAYEGYEGHLTDRVVPFPALLREAGYHTYMAGKWHLGRKPEHSPINKGFEHAFVISEGGANHYSDRGIFKDMPVTQYTEDGQPISWKQGDYSTNVYTDKLISFIGRHKQDGKPFLAYAAYTSPHWPLQVDEKYQKKYEGRYDAGYEALKTSRFETLKKAGMIPTDAILPPSHPDIKSWKSLSKEAQRKEARKMELYAGMVDNLDENIGRLIQYLKEIGQYENTLIIFMSDNGAAAEDFYYDDTYGPFLRQHFSDDYADMGKEHSFISYGPQWAEAGSSPFRYYKGFTTEGGMVAPMIIAGLNVKGSGTISHSFVTLVDIAPTLYELAKVSYPASYREKPLYPLIGSSLMPILSGKTNEIHEEDYVYGIELGGYTMIRKGSWKLVNYQRPFDVNNFVLFDLSQELAEQKDLKNESPEKYREMLQEWEKFSKTMKVRIPTPAQGEGL